MSRNTDAILMEGARKRYGDKHALDGLDLAVRRGTVHGLLGPNGAGKTTAVRVLATLLRHDEGLVRVAGFDVRRQPGEVRRRIGLLGQHAALDEELSGRQNLEMFARLHHLGARRAGQRADELLERFGLMDTGPKAVRAYSGGMRRRLDLAASLITEPEVLFLDEPTTGLDPRGRAEVWDSVRALVGAGSPRAREGRGEGTTVLLTTQYLEEADRLADRISVVDGGRVVADGTPDELKSRAGRDRIDVVVRDGARLDEAVRVLPFAPGDADVDRDRRRISAPVRDRMASLAETVRALEAAGIEAEDVALRRPTLDEVFLHLTGPRTAAAAGPGAAETAGAAGTEVAA